MLPPVLNLILPVFHKKFVLLVKIVQKLECKVHSSSKMLIRFNDN
jgi:hypothetical protein